MEIVVLALIYASPSATVRFSFLIYKAGPLESVAVVTEPKQDSACKVEGRLIKNFPLLDVVNYTKLNNTYFFLL